MHKFIFPSILFVLLNPNLGISQVAVPSEGVTIEELDSYVEQNPKLITYAQWSEEKLRQAARETPIQKLFYKAKECWLKNNLICARDGFIKIVDLALEADWDQAQFLLITHSFLALAEISVSESEMQYWAKRANAFSLGKIAYKDNVSFKLKKVLQSVPRENIISLEIPEWWDALILINGQAMADRDLKRLKLAKGSYRITIISNYFLPQTEVVRVEQISKLTHTRIPAVTGNCSLPNLHSNLTAKDIFHVVFSEECIRKWDGKWLDVTNKKLLPQYDINGNHSLYLENSQIADVKNRFYYKPWFWGLVLASIAVIYHNYDNYELSLGNN